MAYSAITIDHENNAEEWWDALREKYPSFARSLECNGCAVITDTVWNRLLHLPKFLEESAPDYAPWPIVYHGGYGNGWADVVARPHQVFEELS